MPRGIIIPANESLPCEVREFDGLADYQEAVGGFIEPVDLPRIEATLYVNEEGVIRDLPFNVRATVMRWFWMPDTPARSTTVGDAVLIGLPDEEGDTTDIPEWLAENILAPHGHCIEVKLVTGPERYVNQKWFSSYFEAALWARQVAERWPLIEEVRIVPLDLNEAAEDLVEWLG